MTYKIILPAMLGLTLTACGGGGGNNGGAVGVLPGTAQTGANATQIDSTAVNRFNADETLRADLQNSGQNNGVVQPDLIPQSGSSTYTGAATLSYVDNGQTLLAQGNATVTVGFNNDTLTGDASGFILSQAEGGDTTTLTNSRNIDGTLTLRNSEISRAEANAITTNLQGNLDGGNIEVNVDLAGNFYGDNPGTTPDGFLLTPQTTGGTQTADTITVNGTARTADYNISVDNN